ncbi:MAG: putative heme d1 biosynthesis radical SAM protein NirJ1 [Bacillota bacterium]
MIGFSKLLCSSENYGDRLRYVHGANSSKHGVNSGSGPVVVWNCTNTCNLACRHCYANSENKSFKEELTTEEAKEFIDDLSEYKVPVLLISGGEPLLRKDIFEIIKYAKSKNIRITISTNGTVIDKEVAAKIKENQVSYVGISIDGIGERHDSFRGMKGSFDLAMAGIRNCLEIGQKVGLRFTINRHNYDQLEDIFELIKKEKIPRVCFYHLAYSGRGNCMIDEDLTDEEKRAVIDFIMKKTIELGDKVEILTVDNHADAPYLYIKTSEKYPEMKDRVWELLQMNGGNRSGIAIANVDFKGDVHPDQFTQHHTFGNIREAKFSEIWESTDNPILNGLRNRKELLNGRCSQCKWLEICNGNLRARGESVNGDFWESDPACYLTDSEIGLVK